MGQEDFYGINPKVIEEIKEFAKKYGIRQVILFGSRARGDYVRASDIDLAVRGGDIARFTISVKEDTSTLLEFDIIDLGQKLQKGFVDSIRQDGVIIYEKI